jgi:hypothetical protein
MPEGTRFIHHEIRSALRKHAMLRRGKFSQYKKLFFASRKATANPLKVKEKNLSSIRHKRKKMSCRRLRVVSNGTGRIPLATNLGVNA